LVSERQRDWDDHLPFVLMAYRATQHSSTGFSPNKLFLGRENKAPIDLVLGNPVGDAQDASTYDEFVQHQQQFAERSHGLVREQLQRCAERRKATYDLHVKRRQFSPNTWVYYYNPRRYVGRSPKWQSYYTGPYLITRLIPPVNCVLQRARNSKPFVVHYDKLKVVHGATPQSWLTSYDVPSPDSPVGVVDEHNSSDTNRANPITSRQGVEAGSPFSDSYDPFSLNAPASPVGGRPKRTTFRPAYFRDYVC